jgi:glutathione synthase/RimK-type ligase-like ATP-grasp enzyme
MVNEYVEFLQTEIRPYFASRKRKSLRQQWRETRELWAKYRCVPYHYFKHRLYARSARPDFMDYVPAKLVQRFRRDRNPRAQVRMLNDKLETIRALAGTGIRCAETLFSVSASGTVVRGDGAAIGARTAAEALREHGGTLFVKPIDSRAGYGAFSIGATEIDAALIESLRNVVIQPVLRNHPIIEAMSASALNTVRVATLVEDNRCTLIAACLRVGQGKAMVDNWSQGGIAVGVDLTSGALQQTGITSVKYGRRVYAAHPDTGIQFGSVTLPWWRETLELAERAALGLQPHVTLGLDIAITPQGPVFVEANEAGDFFLLQEACGPLGGTRLGQCVLAHWLRTRRSRAAGSVAAESGARRLTLRGRR